MKTHYLDFRVNGGEIHQLSVENSLRVTMLAFWQKNPTFKELRAFTVVDKKNEMTFTMADFTGRSGKLKNIQPVNQTRQLPEGEQPCSPERRREIMAEIKRKSHLFN